MQKELFAAALNITSPFYVERLEFSTEEKRLDVYINFERGSRFTVGSSDIECPVHDTVRKRWRHLNFFEHECYLDVRVPRVKTPEGGIRQVKMPWEGLSPGFTLLFEALLIEMCRHMPVLAVERLSGVSDDKLWRILHCYIAQAIENESLSELQEMGMDETSMRKRHDYVTLFVDLVRNNVIHVSKGKSNEVVKEFAKELPQREASPEQIQEVSCDMSPAFIKGVKENLPNARITFDKFHVMKILNEAVDSVRKQEVKENAILKKTKYLFLTNKENLSQKQLEKLEELSMPKLNLKTVRAMHIKDNFQLIYQSKDEQQFELLLKKWYFWATHSKIDAMVKAAKTIKEHWDGIICWFQTKINNGVLEGINSIVQAAKAKARGYKTFVNFRAVIFLLAGDLDFQKINKYAF